LAQIILLKRSLLISQEKDDLEWFQNK